MKGIYRKTLFPFSTFIHTWGIGQLNNGIYVFVAKLYTHGGGTRQWLRDAWDISKDLLILQYHQNKFFEKVIGKQWFPIQINTTPTLP